MRRVSSATYVRKYMHGGGEVVCVLLASRKGLAGDDRLCGSSHVRCMTFA